MSPDDQLLAFALISAGIFILSTIAIFVGNGTYLDD